MSFEGDFHSLLESFAGGRVYPDVTPAAPDYPLIVYQQVGGSAKWYVEKAQRDKDHARIQVYVWSRTRLESNAIARQVEAAICASEFAAEPYGAFTALYEQNLNLYGTRQDFGIWHQR
jgi:hypothetical protein